MRRKLKYLIRTFSNFNQKKYCPYCKGINLEKIDSKFIITSLYNCQDCHLNHRHPKDSPKWLEKFYQKEYKIDTHIMTYLPSDEELEILKKEGFNKLRSIHSYIDSLFQSKPVNIIDYGCSWGYNVFKLQKSGFNAVGYEVSKPRANFGQEKLGVQIYTKESDIPMDQDLFLSSHVIEHLADLSSFISFSKTRIKGNGIFMAFCPNGNKEYRNREQDIWHGSWGDLHVNLLDVEFAKEVFKNNPYLILSGDWIFNPEEIKVWDGISQKVGKKLDGKELLIIAKPNVDL
ncbi:MAG: hypothetical protein ISQ95_04630 [Flavobacteriales bacterium]|nr:hypothetical protein [Flavobacteriales bacterium]